MVAATVPNKGHFVSPIFWVILTVCKIVLAFKTSTVAGLLA